MNVFIALKGSHFCFYILNNWRLEKRLNYPKSGKMWLYHREMSPKDADGMANSVGCSSGLGSTLFAQTCLSENLVKNFEVASNDKNIN